MRGVAVPCALGLADPLALAHGRADNLIEPLHAMMSLYLEFKVASPLAPPCAQL